MAEIPQGLFRFRHLAALYVGRWTSEVEAERGLVSSRHIRRSVGRSSSGILVPFSLITFIFLVIHFLIQLCREKRLWSTIYIVRILNSCFSKILRAD